MNPISKDVNAVEARIATSMLLLIAALAAPASPAHAANPGDEVIVIYNTKVPESKAVADYYVAKRHVPTNQIFGFALTTEDDMSRAEFRDALQKPLANELETKGLWHINSQIV